MGHEQMISNRYQLGDELGAGGMGIVYQGTDTQTGDLVAVKLLKSEVVANSPDMIERFRREGEALRQLNHPNIVKMLAMVEEHDQHYLIMEFVSGGDLYDMLKQDRRLTIDRLLSIAIQLADALTRAHFLQIVHRDLKPANVLIAADDTPRLTDFGVVHMATKKRVTETGKVIGTLDYLSPESLNGEVVDNRADIWAFGVMLFEMLTGKKPFAGDNVSQIVVNILTAPMPDLEVLCPEAPVALIDLIYRMLEKDRNARIRSVRLVGAELEAIMHSSTEADLRQPNKEKLRETILTLRAQGLSYREIGSEVGLHWTWIGQILKCVENE
jgi:serine/threonine protein kinase